MEIKLRPYQQEAVDAVWNHLRTRDDNPCVVLPTGTGKSVCLAKLVYDAVTNWQGRVLILAHVKELLEQNADKIRKLCPNLKVGIYSAGLKKRDTKNNVIVAGIQSVYKRACELDAFDLIIIDECHLIPPDGDGQYREFLHDAKIINPNARLIGFTATPFRLRGGLICKKENILNYVCYEAGLKEMIVQGYLSPIVPKAGRAEANLDNLHIRGGEFVADEVDVAMNNDRLVSSACAEIVSLTKDRNATLIFGCSIDHCKKIKKRIEEYSGEECALVTGDTPAGERAEILDRIKGIEIQADLFGNKKPRLRYLVNVSVLTTGFDAPNIDCVALLRPTASPGLLLQMTGRGLRLSPATHKQNCLILDYGQNILRHGPLDAIRVEEHEKKRNGGAGERPAKVCPNCKELCDISRGICPSCGYVFPPKELKHDATASEDGLLTGQVVETEYNVRRITYTKWVKKNAPEGTPPTVRIEYELDMLNKYFSEWICPEHTGFARRKFEAWWLEHRQNINMDIPQTVDEAIAMAQSDALKYPVKITVKHVSGERFDRISHYEYGDPPETQFTEQPYNGSPEDDDVLLGDGMKPYEPPPQLEYSGLDMDDGDDVPF